MSRVNQTPPNDWIATNLGDEDHFSFVPVGVPSFTGEKKYLSTSSVIGDRVDHVESVVTYDERPGRANMHPVVGSAWFAKMKDTLKVLAVTEKEFEDSYILSTGFQGVIPKSGDVPFLKQIFLSPFFNAEKDVRAKGSTMKAVNNSDVKNIPILVPPEKEQRKIADILEAVDESIRNAESHIRSTQSLMNGLMRDLFVRGIGHAKYKKTELGELPVGWTIERLDTVARVERGKFSHRPRNAPEFYGGEIPFIQTGDVVSSGGRISLYSQTLNEKGLAVSRMFPKGTIVMTIAANIGDTGILEFDSAFPDSLVGITVGDETNNLFLEYYLRTRKDYLNSIATQSAQKNINLQKLNPMLVVKPPLPEQQEIATILFSIDQKISVDKKIREQLVLLKNGLMNDLLSGKKRTV
jgi:type I restriction enzyme, S subunit